MFSFKQQFIFQALWTTGGSERPGDWGRTNRGVESPWKKAWTKSEKLGISKGTTGERERDRDGEATEESSSAGLLQQSTEAGKVVLVVLVEQPANEVQEALFAEKVFLNHVPSSELVLAPWQTDYIVTKRQTRKSWRFLMVQCEQKWPFNKLPKISSRLSSYIVHTLTHL